MAAEPSSGESRLPAKILMTADAVGGVWRYTLELVRLLCARGTEIVLVVLGPAPSPEQRQEAHSIPGLQLLERDYRLEWQPKPWEDVRRSGELLLELEREFKPEVVHLNGYALASLPWRSPTVVVAHSCVYSWWSAVHGVTPPDDWSLYHGHVEKGLQACRAIVAPSRAMANQLAAEYLFDRTKLRVIYNFSGAAPRDVSKQGELYLRGGPFVGRGKERCAS